MSLAEYAKNALTLLSRGEWREFFFRIRVHLQNIDLRNTNLDELNLPEERCHYYSNSGGTHLDKVLRALKITEQDSVVDFGSGKGGALITLSRYPFARIAGVEISPELVDIAQRNLDKLHIKNVSMYVCDAAYFIDLDAYNYFYFFSPFPSPVMGAVIRNISTSLTHHPRKVSIIYFNPECHDAVVTDSPFVKTNEFNHHELRYFIYTNRP
ncbi:MAG: methyltransferase domain-containing protein [Desulfuromonadales bacterium]|nr:methyltransferase domain-containing protein [Desulfuromonadales bacterium]